MKVPPIDNLSDNKHRWQTLNLVKAFLGTYTEKVWETEREADRLMHRERDGETETEKHRHRWRRGGGGQGEKVTEESLDEQWQWVTKQAVNWHTLNNPSGFFVCACLPACQPTYMYTYIRHLRIQVYKNSTRVFSYKHSPASEAVAPSSTLTHPAPPQTSSLSFKLASCVDVPSVRASS